VDLSPFVEQLRADLMAAAEAGGADLQRAAGVLAAAADPAVRMVLLDTLSAAADELTSAADLVVEVRLRGRDVDLVVHVDHRAGVPEPAPPPAPPAPPAPGGDDVEDGTARFSLRLPETLKSQAERAAAAEGVSLNTWLVRAIATASGQRARPTTTRGTRLSGWARS